MKAAAKGKKQAEALKHQERLSKNFERFECFYLLLYA